MIFARSGRASPPGRFTASPSRGSWHERMFPVKSRENAMAASTRAGGVFRIWENRTGIALNTAENPGTLNMQKDTQNRKLRKNRRRTVRKAPESVLHAISQEPFLRLKFGRRAKSPGNGMSRRPRKVAGGAERTARRPRRSVSSRESWPPRRLDQA